MSSLPPADIIHFRSLRIVVSLTILKHPSPTVLDLIIHPIQAQLAYCLVSDSDIICNSPDPSLVDMICFNPLRIVISLTI